MFLFAITSLLPCLQLPTFKNVYIYFFYFVHIVLFFDHHFQTEDWVEVNIISSAQGKMKVRIGDVVASTQAVYKNDQFKEFYIGGAPRELREKY